MSDLFEIVKWLGFSFEMEMSTCVYLEARMEFSVFEVARPWCWNVTQGLGRNLHLKVRNEQTEPRHLGYTQLNLSGSVWCVSGEKSTHCPSWKKHLVCGSSANFFFVDAVFCCYVFWRGGKICACLESK